MKYLFFFSLFFTCTAANAQIISPGLTAVYEHRRQVVKLKWNHNDKRVVSYTLQKSSNNINWFDVYRIPITQPHLYKFINYADEKTTDGKNYYRLKTNLQGGSVDYTAAVMVIMGKSGNNWLIYPVPVKEVLNLQYNGNALIPGVIVIIIQNIGGRVFFRLRFASSSRFIQLPVSNLGKGIYDIRIVIENEVVWNQRFVK